MFVMHTLKDLHALLFPNLLSEHPKATYYTQLQGNQPPHCFTDSTA